MITTNGTPAHPIPNPQPGDLAPERRPVKRTLFVEEEDNGLTNVWEASVDEVVAWLREQGADVVYNPASKVFGTDGEQGETLPRVQIGEPLGVLGTTPSGEAVRMVDGVAKRMHEAYEQHVREAQPFPREMRQEDEPVRMVGAERAEVGKLPSERATEIMRARLPPPADGGNYVAMISTYDVLAMLDERLGRGGA